jgi:hypothetical protein
MVVYLSHRGEGEVIFLKSPALDGGMCLSARMTDKNKGATRL